MIVLLLELADRWQGWLGCCGFLVGQAPRAAWAGAAAILQAGLSTYLTRHEIMDSELTREQPLPSPATPRPLTTTPR